MIKDGVWIGETKKVFVRELPKHLRDSDEGELTVYCEHTNDYIDSFSIPSTFDEPVLISVGGKRGLIATYVIANKKPIL